MKKTNSYIVELPLIIEKGTCMSNWLSRAFARISGRQLPKAAEDINRAAANANRHISSTVRPAVQRRRSSSGPSYGSRSSGSSGSDTTYYHYSNHASYGDYSGGACGDSGGGGDGGGCGGGGD